MEKLQKRFPKAGDVVINHVYFNIAACNESFALEILQSMSSTEMDELRKNLSKKEEQDKNTNNQIKYKKVAGLTVKKNNERILHKGVSHEVEISDFIACIKTSQSFVNEKDHPVEMVFRFAGVSDTKCVNSVEIETYNPKTKERKRMKAKVKEKERARDEYDDAVASGNSAFVVEKKKEDKLVTLNLGNIQPGVEVKVDIFSSQQLKIVEKNNSEVKIKFSLDSVLNTKEKNDGEDLEMENSISGKVIKNMKVNIKLKEISGEIKKIEIPSIEKDISAEKIKDNLSFDNLSPAKDFNIIITVKNFPVSTCLIKELIDFQYKQVAMLNVLPKSESEDKEDLVSTEFLVIVDCSGSMAGSRIRCAREALLFFLQSLDAEDKIKLNIIKFGSTHSKLFDRPMTLDSNVMKRAKNYANKLNSNMGGTNLFTPLNEVLNVETTPGYSRQILILTDGETSKPLEIIKQVKEFSGKTRIMVVGIGNDINEFFLKNLSEITNGKSVFLSKSDEINDKLLQLLEYCLQPSIHNITVKFPEEFGKVEKVVKKTPLVYFNEVLTEYYFIEKKPEKDEDLKIKMEYTVGESKQTNKIEIPYKSSDNQAFGVLAANSWVNELTKFGSNPKEDKKKILDLGLKFNLLTSETSFFLEIENDQIVEKEMTVENINTVQYVDNSKIQITKTEIPMSTAIPMLKRKGGKIKHKKRKPVSSKLKKAQKSDQENYDLIFKIEKKINEINDLSMCLGSEIEEHHELIYDIEEKSKQTKKKGKGVGKFFKGIGKGIGNIFGGGKKKRMIEECLMEEESEEEVLHDRGGGNEWMYCVENSSGSESDERKEVEEKKEKKSRVSIESIGGGALNKIIFSQEMNGIWIFNQDLEKYLEVDLNKLKSLKPDDLDTNLWFSIIVIAVLEKKFVSEKTKWKLIVKKSRRQLNKNTKNVEKLIETVKKNV